MLDTLFWNDQAKGILRSYEEQGSYPHAILLEGPAGSGRKTLAKLLAAALFCRGAAGEPKPCGRCLPCRKVREGTHPDLIFLGEEGNKSLTVAQVRELRLDAYIRPNEAEHRVTVLCEAQNLTVQAQNALLKLLEEPPEHCVFILTCQNRRGLLPTILSRLQIIPMELPTPEQCAQALARLRPGHSPDAYRRAALAGEGSLGAALAVLEGDGSETLAEEAAALLDTLLHRDEFALLRLTAKYERDREGFLRLLRQLRHQTCALLLTASGARNGPETGFTTLQLGRIAAIIEVTERQTAQNGNMPLLTTAFSSRMKSALGSPGLSQ